jgi:hypothetical protein
VKWRGKPVFIRHRTEDEIQDAQNTKWEALRDPEPDSDRVKKPEWLIMVGMYTNATHLIISNGSDCTQAFALISDVFPSARLEILAAGSVPATAHTMTSPVE